MRWLFRLLCVCALGVMPVVGCSEEATTPECLTDKDCDDQNECTRDLCDTGRCYVWASAVQWEVCDDGVESEFS